MAMQQEISEVPTKSGSPEVLRRKPQSRPSESSRGREGEEGLGVVGPDGRLEDEGFRV